MLILMEPLNYWGGGNNSLTAGSWTGDGTGTVNISCSTSGSYLSSASLSATITSANPRVITFPSVISILIIYYEYTHKNEQGYQVTENRTKVLRSGDQNMIYPFICLNDIDRTKYLKVNKNSSSYEFKFLGNKLYINSIINQSYSGSLSDYLYAYGACYSASVSGSDTRVVDINRASGSILNISGTVYSYIGW